MRLRALKRHESWSSMLRFARAGFGMSHGLVIRSWHGASFCLMSRRLDDLVLVHFEHERVFLVSCENKSCAWKMIELRLLEASYS